MLEQAAAVLFGISLLYISTTSRLGAYIKVLVVQGLMLFVLALAHSEALGAGHAAFIAFETVVVKALVVPFFISSLMKKMDVRRDAESYIDNFLSLIAATTVIVLSFALAVALKEVDRTVDVLTLGVSLSAVVMGLFIMTTRKKLITHVMGYLVLENGIFMLSLSIAAEVPTIVEAGVLLDVFMGVFLMGIMINKIKSEFETEEVEELCELKDCK
jgi:hydrogenase-4 component E